MTPRSALILSLRSEGITFAAIATRFGISRQRAHQVWKREVARAAKTSVDAAPAQS